jgi:plastocyanin
MRRALLILAALAVGGGAAAIPSSGASTKTVLVKDDVFSPAKLTISKGTEVKWLWKGKRKHNIAVANGPSNFRAGTRKKGHFEHTFKKAGRYSIVCTIHAPDMHMVIKVK